MFSNNYLVSLSDFDDPCFVKGLYRFCRVELLVRFLLLLLVNIRSIISMDWNIIMPVADFLVLDFFSFVVYVGG